MNFQERLRGHGGWVVAQLDASLLQWVPLDANIGCQILQKAMRAAAVPAGKMQLLFFITSIQWDKEGIRGGKDRNAC